VAVGSLAPIPTASAAAPLCTVNWALVDAYYAPGDFCWSHGYYKQGWDYWNMAFDLDRAPCSI
jgi:hypothetical protein